ncbi:MAG TPA: RimK/LysX family protein [Fluviicola sp.]|nr:RimK/LysX family protein [Fluviicola sp.]
MAKRVIGRKDIVSFPGFGLENVPVKIDSGAYSSSMHCHSINLVDVDGKQVLEVVFLDPSIEGYTGKKFRFDSYIRKKVKSSNGMSEERFFVLGTVRLFNETVETLFSLTERTGLRNPVLLGRRLLNKRFLIDSSKTNCSFKAESLS